MNYKFDDNLTLEVTHGYETTRVQAWQYLDEQGLPGDDDYEQGGLYLTLDERFSGYTLSEILCKVLIDIGRADDWDEAIYLIDELWGIPYETDEEE